MTSRHTISRADALYHGKAYYPPYQAQPGVELAHLVAVNLGAPNTASAAGILDGVTVSTNTVRTYTAGAMTLATLDVPRNLKVISTDGATANNVVTVTGADVYGQTMVETITLNGTTAVLGKKAFKTLSTISAAAGAAAATMDVGWGDKLGLPFRVDAARQLVNPAADGSVEDFTLAAATATQTAGSNDVRGTVTPSTTTDGAVNFSVLIHVPDVSSKEAVFGVAQYAG